MILLSFILTIVVCVTCTVVAQSEEEFKYTDNSMARLIGGFRPRKRNLEVGFPEDNLIGNGDISINMVIRVFEDVHYKEELVPPVKLPVGTPIFVQLEVDPAKVSPMTRLIGIRCTALPFPRAPEKLGQVIIDEAAAVDMSVVIIEAEHLHTMQFRLQTFKIGVNYKELYMTCSAVICPAGDTSKNCVSDEAKAQHKIKNVRLSKFQNEAVPEHQKWASVESGAVGIEEPEFTDKVEKIIGSKNVIRTDTNGIRYIVTNPGKQNQIVRILSNED